MLQHQNKNIPIHKWKMPELKDLRSYKPQELQVGDFMTTDLLTVQADDIVELVAELMDWRKIRYMPVEDTKGKLIGLITSRLLLRYFTSSKSKKAKVVKDLSLIHISGNSPTKHHFFITFFDGGNLVIVKM